VYSETRQRLVRPAEKDRVILVPVCHKTCQQCRRLWPQRADTKLVSLAVKSHRRRRTQLKITNLQFCCLIGAGPAIVSDVPPFHYGFLRRNKPMAVFGAKF